MREYMHNIRRAKMSFESVEYSVTAFLFHQAAEIVIQSLGCFPGDTPSSSQGREKLLDDYA